MATALPPTGSMRKCSQFSTNLRYEFTRNIAVVTAYSYAKAVYNQNNTTTDRNSVLVSLTIRHPYFDQW